jgi:PAS domain S-box-containing protein
LGRDGTVQRCNPAFERIVGARADEIKGRPVSLVKAQQDQSSAFAEELNCSGAVANVETRLVRKDGSEFDASISYAPLQAEAGGPAGFVAAVQDISDRKRAEEALRRTQAYLAEGQRLSHTGSWHWSVSTGEFVWSQEFFAIFGFDPEKDKPSYQLFVERIDPEDRPTIEEVLWADVGERKDFDVEYRLVLPEGLIKHLHTIGHFVVSQSDDVEYIGTVIDITERKRAEEERERLRQAQADLAHINRVTTMGELTASLAHEIRQPITAAMTNAQSCLRWLGRDQPDLAEAHEAASRIVKDVTRASEIISRIRLLFKKGTPQRELLDVNEVIQEMIALLRNEASRYSISIRCDLANDLPKAMADRVQLQQVFMNLMLNGIEAMKDIGPVGELTIKSQQGDNRQLLISVGDTGVGLQPEQAEQIFNAFFTTNPQGTGMGLPISRSIIESHGGRLWATAHSGQGATFHFTLPSEGGVSGCAASYS